MEMPGMQASSAETKFEWTTPSGWEELPSSQMRAANFRIARDPDTECYLAALPGAAGGLVANVNRWRKQMGLEPMSQASISALPQETLLGQSAFVVDLEGTYVGMGQGAARPGYRMLGLIQEQPGQTVFLKMTGPGATVVDERARFLELAKSLRAAEAPAPSSPEGDGTLQWDTPPGWERRPDQQMRLVTLAPKGSPETECYVTILSGAAGGVEANVNRWRGQLGKGPMAPGEMAGLKALHVLGREAKLVEISGTYTDMRNNKLPDAALVGILLPLEDALLSIKMTGPKDVVERETDHFISFCESLRAP
jgi:hypothetical protein